MMWFVERYCKARIMLMQPSMTERMGFRNGGGIQSKAPSVEFRRMKYLRKESLFQRGDSGHY